MIRKISNFFLVLAIAYSLSGEGRALISPVRGYPDLQEGSFANGMTYQHLARPMPTNQIQLRLVVRAGSLDETDSQQGIAHFIEHLAFNGRGRQILKTIEAKGGVRFGAHSNASTTFDQTVYMLTITTEPGDTETLPRALEWIASVAYDMDLSAQEIADERAVVINELQSRAGLDEKASRASVSTLWPGSRMNQRFPLGTQEVLENAPHREFVNYYKTWYRPELMTVIAVGDLPDNIDALLRTFLDKPQAAREVGKSRPAPVLLEVVPKADGSFLSFKHPDITLPTVNLVCDTVSPSVLVDRGDAPRIFASEIALAILGDRLDTMVEREEAGLALPTIEQRMTGRTATTRLVSRVRTHWTGTLAALAREIHRVHRYGFSDQEVEEAVRSWETLLTVMAPQEFSEPSATIASRLSERALLREPTISPANKLATFLSVKPQLTTLLVTEALKGLLPLDRLSVFVQDHSSSVDNPTQAQAVQVLQRVLAEDLPPWVSDPEIASLGPKPPESSEKGLRESGSFDVTHVTFANSVRLHHKEMKAEPGIATIQVSFAGGRAFENEANLGITTLGLTMLEDPATSEYSPGQIRQFLSDKTIRITESLGFIDVSEDISGSVEDLELGLQLLAVIIREGQLNAGALYRKGEACVEEINTLRKDRDNIASQNAMDALASPDTRFKLLQAKHVRALAADPKKVEAWMKQVLQESPMEVTIVGDIALEDATALVARYLGSLPARKSDSRAVELSKRATPKFSGPQTKTYTIPQDSTQAQVIVAWSVVPNIFESPGEIAERRALMTAVRAVESRIRDAVREEGEFSYSANTSFDWRPDVPGLSSVNVAFLTPKGLVEQAVEVAIATVITAAGDLSDKEIEVAKTQLIKEHLVNNESPRYWNNVLDAFDMMGSSDMILRYRTDSTHITSYKSITTAAARAALKKVAQDENLLVIKVIPE